MKTIEVHHEKWYENKKSALWEIWYSMCYNMCNSCKSSLIIRPLAAGFFPFKQNVKYKTD